MVFRFIVESKKTKDSKWKPTKTWKFTSGELRPILHRTRLGALSDLKMWQFTEFNLHSKKYRRPYRIHKIRVKSKKRKKSIKRKK